MCGILGTLNYAFSEGILDLIKHRGPDDFGLEKFDIGNNTITFGHRRLSIVDLSEAGHQPMMSACGNFAIVFNGEIYNHMDLRERLTDINFRGHSDTETIVNYIAKFGIESVKDFNGIFGFCILNKKTNEMYLARDRYGVKPLYYYHSNDKFAFSSEIRPIKAIVDTNVSIDNISLMLRLRYTPSPYTLFNNIFKVRPGHFLKLDLNNYKLTHKSFLSPVKINRNITFEEALEKYGYYFENAVKRQLMSDVDVGMLLSGGVDSALVTYFATKHYNKKMKTFTVGFTDKDDANELEEAKETAKLFDTEHFEIIINSDEYDSAFKKLIDVIEEPLGTTSTIPLYYMDEVVSKHVKVVLTGQGADEPLGGYPRYQGELYLKLFPSQFFSGASLYQDLFKKKEKISRAVYALSEEDIVKRFDRTYALFRDEEINSLTGAKTKKSIECIKYYYELLNGNQKDPVEALMANDLHMNLSDDLLLCADKISMNFSLEARVPILDNDLVDFIESLPYSYRVDYRKGKVIHKKFSEQALPKEIVYRRKKGFQTPTEKWFKESIGNKYYEMLCFDKTSNFSKYFNIENVKLFFEEHRNGINREKQLFSLISMYYWLEMFS